MKKLTTNARQEFKIYHEILHGRLQPFRIQIRAYKLLNDHPNPDQLKFIALKNLKNAEYLLRESTAISSTLLIPADDPQKKSLLYITDNLKKLNYKTPGKVFFNNFDNNVALVS